MRLFKSPSAFRQPAKYSEPPMVGVYLRAGTVYMHPFVKTTTGIYIFAEPVVAADQTDPRIATQLLELLSVRRTIVPHPTLWKGLTDSLTKLAKARSFNAFAVGTKLVEVSLENDDVQLLPTRNGGQEEGFVHRSEKTKRCPPSAEPVWRALQAAFADCE
jgi:hypothetical protein